MTIPYSIELRKKRALVNVYRTTFTSAFSYLNLVRIIETNILVIKELREEDTKIATDTFESMVNG